MADSASLSSTYIHIRPAKNSDQDSLLHLRQRVWLSDPYKTSGEAHSYADLITNEGRCERFVVEVAGLIVGVAGSYLDQVNLAGEPHIARGLQQIANSFTDSPFALAESVLFGHIQELIVDPSWRNQRIGTLLGRYLFSKLTEKDKVAYYKLHLPRFVQRKIGKENMTALKIVKTRDNIPGHGKHPEETRVELIAPIEPTCSALSDRLTLSFV